VEAFPFPHRVEIEAKLDGAELRIATTVRAGEEGSVPIAFGFHPYLQLPEVERSEWRIEAPVRERLDLDGRMLPTGRRQPVEVRSGRLGSRTFDDAFLAPPDGEPFVLSGGGRRLELRMGEGYPFAQIYAPADLDAVAFEPMTAKTCGCCRRERASPRPSRSRSRRSPELAGAQLPRHRVAAVVEDPLQSSLRTPAKAA
jgi:galactose mutarotase-like enzyme